jgi:hypothetical protein
LQGGTGDVAKKMVWRYDQKACVRCEGRLAIVPAT